MAPSDLSLVSSFIEGAPPGELAEVVADIKILTSGNPKLIQSLGPAFESYNEEQFSTVKLPGIAQPKIISQYNRLPDGRYYDVESNCSWEFDHVTQKASAVREHSLDSPHVDLIRALLKALSHHASEHFPTASYGVFPPSDSTSTSTSGSTSTSTFAILLVSNRYSPQNFWNGRWRSLYHLPLPLSFSTAATSALSSPASTTTTTTATPTTVNPTLTGAIKLDVHYYEDGNVRLQTTKPISLPLTSSGIAIATGPGTATQIMRQIAQMEKKYQEELNRAFGSLSEGAFKALRRQLPVTRRKVEWERVGAYKLGQDIGGGSSSMGR